MTVWTPSNTTVRCSATCFALLATLAACGSDARAPGPSSAGLAGASGSAGSSGSSASGGQGTGGDASTAGAGAEAGASFGGTSAGGISGMAGGGTGGVGGSDESGAAGAGASLTIISAPYVCPDEGSLGSSEPVDLPIGKDDVFGSITPDERFVAWTSEDGSRVTLYTAERASADDDFDTPSAQEIPAAPGRVAISSDGLRVVFVNASERGLSAWTRETASDPFTDTDALEFELFDQAEADLADGERYADPVLSADDRTLVYSRFGGDRTRTLFVSHRYSEWAPWPLGSELAITSDFEANGGDRFQPTGLASDAQTLFLWHASENTEYAVFLNASTLIFDRSLSLGNVPLATPIFDCSRLYHASDDGTPGLFLSRFQ